MKSLLASTLLCLFTAVSVLAQGQLPPTGAPGATMKSLDQIEPRTDILKLPDDATYQHIISASGSYFLSASTTFQNKSAIKIAVDNVTIDLNGFRLVGGAGSYFGIDAPALRKNVVVRNGTVTGWGAAGIYLGLVSGGEIRNVVASDGPAGADGISCGRQFRLTDCVAHLNGDSGFQVGSNSVVTNCISQGNTAAGFSAAGSFGIVFSECVATGNGNGGVLVGQQANLRNCTARSNAAQVGFLVSKGSSLFGCTSALNGS